MRHLVQSLLLTFCFFSFFVGSVSGQQTFRWAKSFGGVGQGPNTGERDQLFDFKTDNWGNAYVAAGFYSDVYIDTFYRQVPVQVDFIKRAVNSYVAKISCTGETEWVSQWKGAAEDQVVKGLITYKNYVYAVGNLYTGQNYPVYIDDTMLASGGYNQRKPFVVKYDVNTGQKLRYISIPSDLYQIINFNSDGATEVRADKYCNIYFHYATSTSRTIGSITIPSGKGIMKVDSNFNYVTHIQVYAPYNPNTSAYLGTGDNLAIDDDGNVYATSMVDTFIESLFGGEVIPDYGIDHRIGYVAKFSTNLELQWYFQHHIIGSTPVGQVGGSNYDPIIGLGENVYIPGRLNACLPPNYTSCAVLGDDTMITQYAGGVGSGYAGLLLTDFNAETGTLERWRRLDRTSNAMSSTFGVGGGMGGSGITPNKDTLYLAGVMSGGPYYWDTSVINVPITTYQDGISRYVLKFDTAFNLLNLQYSAGGGGNASTRTFFLTSSGSYYWAGDQAAALTFPDSTLYPMNGIGTSGAESQYDLYIAQFGYGSSCYRCDTPVVAFEVEQHLDNTAVISANNTVFGESYIWDFGFGQSSTQRVPTTVIQYPDTGTYEICLTASNFCSSRTYCKNVTIGCPPPLLHGFGFSTSDLSLQIDSIAALQADSYLWSFGDGSTSTDSLPQHTYSQSGSYNVCLKAYNGCDSARYCKAVTVSANGSNGIVRLSDGGTVKVYPNPTTGLLNITLNGLSSQYQLAVSDAMGRQVLSDKIGSKDKQLNISSFSSGVYMLSISNAKETHSIRIIKQ